MCTGTFHMLKVLLLTYPSGLRSVPYLRLYPIQEFSIPGISCTIFIADTVGMVYYNKRIEPVDK